MTGAAAGFSVRLAAWPAETEALRALRLQVFVHEQGVPEALEWDGIDADCRHAIACDQQGAPIGCGRLLPDGHIGRMAVLQAWRSHGVGSAILLRLVELARELGHDTVALNAQTQALGFYQRHGFVASGPVYDDAGIPHQAMERSLGQD